MESFVHTTLIAILAWLHVTPLPLEPNPDWKVTQNWTMNTDGDYSLVMESTAAPEECRKSPYKKLILPMVIQSAYRVSDKTSGAVVFQQGDWQMKELESYFEKPYFNCQILAPLSTIVFEVKTKLPNFASIKSYPQVSNNYLIPLLSQQLSTISIGILIAILIYLLGSFFEFGKFDNYYYLVLACGFLLFNTYVYFPVKFGQTISHVTAYKLLYIGLWPGVLLLLYNLQLIMKTKSVLLWISIAVWVGCLFIIFGNYNLETQFFFCTLQAFSVYPSMLKGMLTYVFKHALKGEVSLFEYTQSIIFIIVLCTGLSDILLALGYSELPFFVPVSTSLSVTCLLFILNQDIVAKKQLMKVVNMEKTQALSGLANAKSLIQEQEKIIHDIKSPLTAIRFLIEENEHKDERIKMILNRIDSFTQNLFVVDRQRLAIKNKTVIDRVVSGLEPELAAYAKIFGTKFSLNYENSIAEPFELPLTQVELSRVLANTIYNSIESASNNKCEAHLTFNGNRSNIEFYVKDNNVRLSKQQTAERPFSGLGLTVVKDIVTKAGGTISNDMTDNGYLVEIRFG